MFSATRARLSKVAFKTTSECSQDKRVMEFLSKESFQKSRKHIDDVNTSSRDGFDAKANTKQILTDPTPKIEQAYRNGYDQ